MIIHVKRDVRRYEMEGNRRRPNNRVYETFFFLAANHKLHIRSTHTRRDSATQRDCSLFKKQINRCTIIVIIILIENIGRYEEWISLPVKMV